MKKENKEAPALQRDAADKLNKQSINKGYLALYLAVAVIVLAFGFTSFFVFHESLFEILKDVVGNLLGVFAAFLIFDIINEKIQKDSYSHELSKSISEAIMARPETLSSFTQEQRSAFIRSVVRSSVQDDDVAQMITDQCLDYLSKGNYDNIRLNFDYKFELFTTLPASCSFLSDPADYFYVQEILGYSIRQIKSHERYTGETVSIGFLFNNKAIDDAFRSTSADEDFNRCIFRENLDLKPADTDYLRRLPQEDFKALAERLFKLDLQVDQVPGRLKDARLHETGIVLTYDLPLVDKAEHNVRIIFHMPKLYGTLVQVVLSEPTKAPNITVSYPEEEMDVEMYAFLSKGRESSYEIAHEKKNGIYDIALNTEWIYPISGMIFFPERRRNEEKERQK